jgi:hypothetical protein
LLTPSVARALVACAAVGAISAAARAEWRTLPRALASRRLEVDASSVHWIDSPGLGARRALVLARVHGQPADVYVVSARTGGHDQVIRIESVSNLTRSPNAEETDLVGNGRFAAFATRVNGEAIAVSVVDTAGVHGGSAHADRGARIRGAMTRWQQTGRSAGYDIDRFDLRRSARTVALAFDGAQLRARTDEAAVVIDANGPRVREGAEFVRERPRVVSEPDNWVTWAVDTVRAVPWIGPQPIAWAESIAFRARTAARRASRAVATTTREAQQQEVAADLADVLSNPSTGTLEGATSAWPPAPLRSPLGDSIAHEGEWSAVGAPGDPFVQSNPGAPPPMYITFVRTDRELEDARAYVLLWDARQIELHVAPGSQEPMGATGETGSGVVPRDEATLTRLVGGFNGAFQGLHGEYGVYAEGALLLPPKPYAATIALMADGSTAFGSWPAEQHEIPDDIVEFRQNLTALVDGGQYNPWRRDDWGAVLNNPADLRTARTGLCLTREQYIAFVWGADLNPRGLADAMLAARCEYAVHLDMNGINTAFEFYRVEHRGQLPPAGHRVGTSGSEAEGEVDEVPGLVFRSRRMVRSMPHQVPRYIRRNPRDFFYLLLRPVLPGAPLAPVVSPAVANEGTWHVAGLSSLPFPWPLARTRLRPDPSQPDRWVNLVRIDARRVQLAPPDAQANVVARVMNAEVASDPGTLRISMTSGSTGPHWSIGTEGTGIAGTALAAGMSPVRGACIDSNGFLVMAVADRVLPDLVQHALDHAGCVGPRIALVGATLVLPSGEGVAGESNAARGTHVLSLVEREFPGPRRIFPEVTPVARSVWAPVQNRRVRYFPNPGNNVTVQVRLAGQQQPQVFRLAGVAARFVQQAYPDGGAPPAIPGSN